MTTTTATTIITGMVNDIGAVLTDSLPVVFTIVGVLIGVFFGVKQIKKNIGRAK